MPAKSPAANVQQKEVGRQPNPRDGKNDARDGGAPDNGENADNCYICDNGGMLVCCDHCDKSFHLKCHIPPLEVVPKGNWKCCECAASSYKKRFKCGACEVCLREDCKKCEYCLDMPKYGGLCKSKQVCIHKRCPLKRYAPPATVTPEAKKQKVSRIRNASANTSSPVAGQTTLRHDDNCDAARSFGGDVRDDTDAFSQATVPFLSIDGDGNGDDDEGALNNNTGWRAACRDVVCQMELTRAKTENRRQADEIARLKSAVRALTASLTG